MKDNEIIQVLKNHIEAEDCVSCESFGKCDEFLLTEKVLDLITRQQAEIERLKEEHDKNFEKWILLSDKTKQHYAELYDEAKEIVKSEAVKEFAEKLKRVWSDNHYDSPDIEFDYFIDLVKEMVGRKNEN